MREYVQVKMPALYLVEYAGQTSRERKSRDPPTSLHMFYFGHRHSVIVVEVISFNHFHSKASRWFGLVWD